jgi:hypothetical protein
MGLGTQSPYIENGPRRGVEAFRLRVEISGHDVSLSQLVHSAELSGTLDPFKIKSLEWILRPVRFGPHISETGFVLNDDFHGGYSTAQSAGRNP